MGVINQAASGYGAAIYNTPLAQIEYSNEIIAKWYEQDYLPEITNTRIAERITSCSQIIQFLKSPTGGEWRPYQEDQAMVPAQVSLTADCVTICNMAYNAIKFDTNTIRQACTNWPMYEAAFLTDNYEKLATMLREDVLAAMISEASPMNQGANAGKFRNINLGTVAAPITITKDNLPLQLAKIQQVLFQQLAWKPGEMFMIMPIQFRPVYVQSNYANAMWVGNCQSCSPTVDGMLSQQLMGFNIIETISSPGSLNAAGNPFFYIIAGNREAYAFAADIIEARLVTDPYTFGIQYQMLAAWGGKALYPQALAVMVATFDYGE